MAIAYTKQIPADKWILSDNNNILEFTNDDVNVTPTYASISIGSNIVSKIPVSPDGTFWINLKDYISPLLNDYVDSVDPSGITAGNLSSFVFDWGKVYLSTSITVTMYLTDLSSVIDTTNVKILLGVEQVLEVQKQMTMKSKEVAILSPFMDRENQKHYIKYWEGYPFDIAYTSPLSGAIENRITKIKNLSNALETLEFDSPNNVNRIFFSNGDEEISIEEHLPLRVGMNVLEFDANCFVYLDKEDTKCGSYFKWLNQQGGYNYWLFEASEESAKTNQGTVINNDFSNVEDTISQSISGGRVSGAELKVQYDNLTPEQIYLLRGLAESPKIYYYTGERFSPNTASNWIEVIVDNKSFVMSNFKNKQPSGDILFDLPNRYTIRL